MIGYSKIGDGDEKVMVVHGWKTDHTCFDSMTSSLDQKTFSYVFVDQRGYGKSIDLEGPYDIPQVAKDMATLADDLGWNHFHLIGHSMGGKVIQRVMADCPDRIKSAIGITPCPAGKLPFDKESWDLFSGADTDSEKRLQVFRLATGDRLTDTWYENVNVQSLKASKPEAFRSYLDSWVNYDLVEDIMGCRIPIKVIVGEYDEDFTNDVMQATYGEWFTNSKIVKLSNCGHYPMFETPLSLATEWESFLKQHR